MILKANYVRQLFPKESSVKVKHPALKFDFNFYYIMCID